MDATETALAFSAPSATGETSEERSLQRIEELRCSDRTEGECEKLPICMALVDPQPLMRRLIGDLLAEAFPECTMVAASTCEELLEMKGQRIESPSLVIICIRGTGLTNTCIQSALDLLRLQVPEASAVVLSDRDDVDEVNRALTHGARGFIPTSVDHKVAVAALRLIIAGGTFVPAAALRSTAAKPNHQPEGQRQRGLDGRDLTPRELSVIDLLREGKPNKLIAAELDMQENTVKVHVRNILKKLNAANRTHAAFVANRLLGRDTGPVTLPNSPWSLDQAQSPGVSNR